MTKFSAALRMYVISLLKKGDSMAHVSRTIGISRSVVQQWWYHYQQGGTMQVFHTNRAYTPEFKQYVLETKWQNRLSLTQTATQFQIPNSGIIWQWEHAFLTHGAVGLQPKRKGRSPVMAKKKSTLSRDRRPHCPQSFEAKFYGFGSISENRYRHYRIPPLWAKSISFNDAGYV